MNRRRTEKRSLARGNTHESKGIILKGPIVVTLLSIALFSISCNREEQERVSGFGEYRGYSKEMYDGYVRRSDYLTLSDGTRLAYDLMLPAKGDAAVVEPMPVLFSFTTYLRAFNMVKDGKVIDNEIVSLNPVKKAFIWLRAKIVKNGNIFDQAFMNKWVKKMLRHGYAVVIVEQRGTGASEGLANPIFQFWADDADEVLNWIATQPWSNGKIGMFGESSLAIVQYAAASTGNPHLKAIFPVSASFDMYNAVMYPGGIFNAAFAKMFSFATGLLEDMAVPVDSDRDGARLREILEHRQKTVSLSKGAKMTIEKAPYRDSDSIHPKGTRMWDDVGLYTLLDKINRSGIPIYNATGWFDIFTRDAILWHNNLKGRRRLSIRPVSHYALEKSSKDLNFDIEAHRWFDYWLRGIDNGIMDEPAIHYFVMGVPESGAWRTAREWPLQNEQRTKFYFSEGGSVGSDSEKGLLIIEKPESKNAFDAYTVDYSTTSGVNSRWNSVIQEMDYPDMALNDGKAITYTTAPLEEDVEITGHPVVHLFIATQARDMDFFVYLEEVDSRGRSTYITEGCLRASHRALGRAPFNNVELPFHRSFKEDLKLLPPGDPIELAFDLLPTSRLFHRGNRIRISITCADADNFKTPVLRPAPVVRILRNGRYASFVELPIIPNK
jgi:putative CocE/NonD family hydrolase